MGRLRVPTSARRLLAVGLNPEAMLAEVERVSFTQHLNDGRGHTLLKNLSAAITDAARAAGWKKLKATEVSRVMNLVKENDLASQRAT